MKALLAPALLLLGLPLLAQTSTTTSSSSTTTTAPSSAPAQPSPTNMMDQVMSVLTPAERTQLTAARTKAMADNPTLQTEEMDLMQKGMALQGSDATDADRQAFRGQMRAHGDKVRAAMVKADPTIEPVLKKIEAQVAKLRAQYQAAH